MTSVRVRIEDESANLQVSAELPGDVEMGRLIPALIVSMRCPLLYPDGRLIEYHLFHRDLEITMDQTLEQAGVQRDSTLTLTVVPATMPAPVFLKTIPAPQSFAVPIRSPRESALFLERITERLAFEALAGHGGEPQPPVRRVPPGGDGDRVWVCLWDLVQVCIRPLVELPADARMEDLVPALAAADQLPVTIDGIDLPYELRSKSGRRLRRHETLAAASVRNGDTLFFMLGEGEAVRETPGWQCGGCNRVWESQWKYCPLCGRENSPGRASCGNCGQSLPAILVRFCPNCAATVTDGERLN